MIAIPLLVAWLGAPAVAQDCVPDLSPEACETLLEFAREAEEEEAAEEYVIPTVVSPLTPDDGPAPMDDLETWVEDNRYEGGAFFDRPGNIAVPDDGNIVDDAYIIEIPEVSPPVPVD